MGSAVKSEFNDAAWKQRWFSVRQEASANQLKDSGWSKETAERCDVKTSMLIREFLNELLMWSDDMQASVSTYLKNPESGEGVLESPAERLRELLDLSDKTIGVVAE